MYYLSNIVKEEALLVFKNKGKIFYQESMVFLYGMLDVWKKQKGITDEINIATDYINSPNNHVQIFYKGYIEIYFGGVPRIRETSWENLFETVKQAIIFPSIYFPLNWTIVNTSLLDIPKEIKMKAICDLYNSQFVEEDLYIESLNYKQMPTEGQLADNPNYILHTPTDYKEKDILDNVEQEDTLIKERLA